MKSLLIFLCISTLFCCRASIQNSEDSHVCVKLFYKTKPVKKYFIRDLASRNTDRLPTNGIACIDGTFKDTLVFDVTFDTLTFKVKMPSALLQKGKNTVSVFLDDSCTCFNYYEQKGDVIRVEKVVKGCCNLYINN